MKRRCRSYFSSFLLVCFLCIGLTLYLFVHPSMRLNTSQEKRREQQQRRRTTMKKKKKKKKGEEKKRRIAIIPCRLHGWPPFEPRNSSRWTKYNQRKEEKEKKKKKKTTTKKKKNMNIDVWCIVLDYTTRILFYTYTNIEIFWVFFSMHIYKVELHNDVLRLCLFFFVSRFVEDTSLLCTIVRAKRHVHIEWEEKEGQHIETEHTFNNSSIIETWELNWLFCLSRCWWCFMIIFIIDPCFDTFL